MARKVKTAPSALAAYLRSIDIELDAEEPDRIEHFMPTEKSVRLVNLLLANQSDRASIVIAPYGSGKSLAASYALHLIENRDPSMAALKTIAKRLEEVAPEMGQFAQSRHRSTATRGLVIPLSGPVPELHLEIANKTNRALRRFKLGREAAALRAIEPTRPEGLPAYLDLLQKKCGDWGFDRVAILWDEFGKHLEYLVQEGRASQLFHVQKLAEYVSRTSVPMSLGVILHMGLLHYASALSQAARAEWRKVEGRFSTIDYVDDSKHLYSLIARLIRAKRESKSPDDRDIDRWVNVCREHQLFRDFTDAELRDLLSSAFPMTPAALYLLPRITGRVAQNERTLFHFLHQWDGQTDIRPAELFDYFSPQLKADITTGGTHRVWLEATSALRKVQSDEQLESVIKTACLFGLGLEGQRGGATLSLLRRAWQRFDGPSDTTACPVRSLIERKLLLYRQYKDEVAVWHGTDLDLRGHLEAEKARRGPSFDLLHFLNEQTPPPFLRPLSYNSEFCIRRYFSGEFRAVNDGSLEVAQFDPIAAASDGHIIYWLPNSRTEHERAIDFSKSHDDPLLLSVCPPEPLPLADAALEVHCLYAMQKDADLVASDPLALDEISQLASDAEAHLHNLVRRCTTPAPGGPTWFYRGRKYRIRNHEDLRERLSSVCRHVYSKTPRLNNELINKRSPSAVLVNSRKKLMLGILERCGQPDLGLIPTTPDGSMFRTLLLATGLYRDRSRAGWGFVDSSDSAISDSALAEVWAIIEDFFSNASEGTRSLEGLLSVLMAPPHSIRPGVIPILLAAGIRAFGGMAAIRRDGILLDDMLPTTVESMAQSPWFYTVEPIQLRPKQLAFIRSFLDAFGLSISEHGGTNILRIAGELLIEWRESLPPFCKRRDFGIATMNAFRDAVFSTRDYVVLLTECLPAWARESNLQNSSLRTAIATYKEELENADRVFYRKIESAIRQELGLAQDGQINELVHDHAAMFSTTFIDQIPDKKAAQFLRRLKMPYSDANRLCRSIAQLLTEQRIRDFDERTMELFLNQLRKITGEIDRSASWADSSLFGAGLRSWLISNRRARIGELYKDLTRLAGPEHAADFVNSLNHQMEGQGR